MSAFSEVYGEAPEVAEIPSGDVCYYCGAAIPASQPEFVSEEIVISEIENITLIVDVCLACAEVA